MKVFVRTSELGGEDPPTVIASYRDDSTVPDDAHGDGVTVLTLPMSALAPPPRGGATGRPGGRLPTLAKDWREKAGTAPVKAEAKRRIEQEFSITDQLNALRELLANVLEHGADVGRWPDDARAHKAELDEKWRYVAEVRERARAHAPSTPIDPGSDKAWPRRLASKS